MKRRSALLLCTAVLGLATMTGCTSGTGPSLTPGELTRTPPTDPSLPAGTTIVVDSLADDGPGSLRSALLDAQEGDTITFDPVAFPPDDPQTISVSSGLPQLTTGSLTIDASDAGVILDGSLLPPDSWIPGLEIVSDGNTIRGLQVINFTGTGLVVAQGQNNTIGGDRSMGAGPTGQGNMTNRNDFGIGLWDFATHNVVTGNLVGTDLSTSDDLGNQTAGVVLMENAVQNVIGPDNIIASNGICGVQVRGSTSYGNTITQNRIFDNGENEICLEAGGNLSIHAPVIGEFQSTTGIVAGTACGNCRVEVFSNRVDEGAFYEGQAMADTEGSFAFTKGTALENAKILCTATDPEGNTSEYSRPAGSTTSVGPLQEGNASPRYWLLSLPSSELLADSRLGAGLYSSNIFNDIPNLATLQNDYYDMSVKRLDTSMQEIEEPIDWNRDEFEIPVEYDQFIDDLNNNGVLVNYMLHFWDKAGHANGDELSTPRFTSEDQVADFLEYVRFVVSHFKGRIQYYTLWSEPDNCGGSQVKCIQPDDYINLSRQVIPAIREEDPDAKVALAPNVLFFDRDYLFSILTSDVIPMFDVIQWHGIYDVVPESDFFGDYYYEYPAIIAEIQRVATDNGFEGEFWGTELTWCSEEYPSCHPPDQPWGILETDKLAAKHYARGIILHLGMDVGVGYGGLESTTAPWSYPTIRNLHTIMARTEPSSLAVNIESEATDILSYGFTTPDGHKLLAFWTDGIAVENDPGIPTSLRFPSQSFQSVNGIDVLYGVVQELVTEMDGGDLVIQNLLVKDYPIILWISE
jgi:hypothetical protein